MKKYSFLAKWRPLKDCLVSPYIGKSLYIKNVPIFNLNFGKTFINPWFLIQFILNLVYIILIGLSKIITAWNFNILIFSDFGARKKRKQKQFVAKNDNFSAFLPHKKLKNQNFKNLRGNYCRYHWGEALDQF